MAMCDQPGLNARIAELCFGDTASEDRASLEAHLLVCDECWIELQRISEAVHVLRAVEEAAVLPWYFLDPGVAAAHLCGRDRGQTGGRRHAEQSGEEAATGVRAGVMHGQLLGDRRVHMRHKSDD